MTEQIVDDLLKTVALMYVPIRSHNQTSELSLLLGRAQQMLDVLKSAPKGQALHFTPRNEDIVNQTWKQCLIARNASEGLPKEDRYTVCKQHGLTSVLARAVSSEKWNNRIRLYEDAVHFDEHRLSVRFTLAAGEAIANYSLGKVSKNSTFYLTPKGIEVVG